MRNQLPYKVECKSSYPFFETIAAFNCERAATYYAGDCFSSNPTLNYRVTKNKKVLANFYNAT